jgi:hypothetical protein
MASGSSVDDTVTKYSDFLMKYRIFLSPARITLIESPESSTIDTIACKRPKVVTRSDSSPGKIILTIHINYNHCNRYCNHNDHYHHHHHHHHHHHCIIIFIKKNFLDIRSDEICRLSIDKKNSTNCHI